MTTIRFADNRRAVVRHEGAPGADGATGAPGEVQGPASSVVDNVALFAATDGNSIKDSGVAISTLASVAALGTKVDKDGTKVLSDVNFSTSLAAKLNALSEGTFLGNFDDEAQLIADATTAIAGDWAIVIDPVPGAEAQVFVWDTVNEVWTAVALGSTPHTAAEIIAELLTDPDFNVLTDARLDVLNNSVSTDTFNAAIAAFAGGTAFATVIRETTVARVLSLPDAGAYIRLENAGGCDIEVPNDATVTWVGFPEVRFYIATAAVPVTLTLGVGVVVNNSGALAGLAQFASFNLKKIGSNEWDLVAVG